MNAVRRLIIFLKPPRPGLVKTRLGQEIGQEAAVGVYRQLVDLLLSKLTDLAHVELRFTPDDAQDEIKPWAQPGWRLKPQGPGHLGERMRRAFLTAMAEGAGRVVLIGSDCPDVDRQDLEEAWAALNNHEVVLGPARDGGYWLIGLRRDQPLLFKSIPWSTATVLQNTLERCREAGLSTQLLRELEDVDTAADWQRAAARYGLCG